MNCEFADAYRPTYCFVSIYFLWDIFSPPFTIRFPMCTIIILADFSLAVLCYVAAVLTLALISIKTGQKT